MRAIVKRAGIAGGPLHSVSSATCAALAGGAIAVNAIGIRAGDDTRLLICIPNAAT